jgi:hypothetical protein
MRPKYHITFTPAPHPIREAVTKFGGQPTWLTEPQWPLSRMYQTPMLFVCQVALAPEVFGRLDAQMAYLFMTEYSGQGVSPSTWEPAAGENAVLLQPGYWSGPTLSRRQGPSLYRGDRQHAVSCEYAVKLTLGEDPDVYDVPEWAVGLDDEGDPVVEDEMAWKSYLRALFEAKIGGTAVPHDRDARPSPGPGSWHLLVQFAEQHVPFSIDFGGDGVGYAFLSADGTTARFVHQRP